MIKFTLKGVAPFDGVHDLDIPEREPNMREFHIIKELSGVRIKEVDEAIAAADGDVMVALIVIALIRNGRIQREQWRLTSDLLYDADAGAINAEFIATKKTKSKKEGEALPPPPPLSDVEPPSGEPES